MKIAITGASGFIGKVLVPMLSDQGHSLQLLTRGPGASHDGGNTRFIQGDVLQENSLIRLVAGTDVVIHLAAMISMGEDVDPNAFRVNVEGTRYLLAAARQAGAKRFIYISSVTAFEQAPYDEPMDESRGPATAPPPKVLGGSDSCPHSSANVSRMSRRRV